ncbi:flagellar filament capping protein FliD [Cupriavidus sp. CuC1]|uniref:flagellar filament capping protein FliD n=1 Tax=Cupriavidus sp. CuC1 TaxID=3373131 RepID=UPI0037D8FA28
MATISNLGVGSGLDLNTLLDQLTTAEQAPLTVIQNRATSYQAKLSAYGQVQSMLSAFQGSAKQLSDPNFFNSTTATSSAANVLGAVGSTSAVSGTYAVNVTSLAQAQSLVSVGQAKMTDAIGTGTIHIDFGTITGGALDAATGKYTGATFATNPPPASGTSGFDIKIDSTNNSLQGIRDAINKANGGVTASIVNDGSGTPYRLVLSSNATGANSSMRISVAETDGGTKLSDLVSYSPGKNPDPTNPGNDVQNMQQTIVAQNAQLTVNNIAVQSTSNTVSDAIQGVTLSLSQGGLTTVTVQRDVKTIQTAVQGFVTAYNNLQKTAAGLSSYDPASQSASPLTGDATLRLIQSQMRGILNTPQQGGSGAVTGLANIGVTFQVDGSMAFDATKLTSALTTDPNGVAGLFSNANGKDGYGNQINNLVTTLTGTKGTLTNATDGITQTLKSLSVQYSETQTRINATVAQYKAQFTNLDLIMSSMNNTSKYLTQQFNALNNSSSK